MITSMVHDTGERKEEKESGFRPFSLQWEALSVSVPHRKTRQPFCILDPTSGSLEAGGQLVSHPRHKTHSPRPTTCHSTNP